MGRSAARALPFLAILLLLACTAPVPESSRQKADPRLRDIARANPDSMVSVLVRTAAQVGRTEQAALERARFSVRSVLGDVVTGDLRARDIDRVTALSFVVVMEASRDIPLSQPTN